MYADFVLTSDTHHKKSVPQLLGIDQPDMIHIHLYYGPQVNIVQQYT
jgi:hypothetical protein